MPAYIDLTQGNITGESQEEEHKDWVYVESISNSVMRSIQEGATGVQRSNGETSLGDIVCVKTWDSSSPQLAESVANGRYVPEVVIHLTSTINDKNCVNLEIKLTDVILTSYSFHGSGSQDPVPTEEITMNYTKIEWTYTKFNDQGGSDGQFPGAFDSQSHRT